MRTDTGHRPAWIFDRADRLSALAARARALAHALYRERCDVPPSDPAMRDDLARRIALNEGRFRRLSTRAAKVRRGVTTSGPADGPAGPSLTDRPGRLRGDAPDGPIMLPIGR